jgi:oxygen-independent coproporphyrinogen-3 oxidase
MIEPRGPENWAKKDNEFVAWYPLLLTPDAAAGVWKPKPAGYYVHIPFCTAICDYCGFAVQKLKNADTGRYVTALRNEITRYADAGRLSQHEFICGHFGGGTPSTIPPEQLVGIKRLLDERALVRAGAEITVEVNPISFTGEHARMFADNGINRISVGVQSFDNETLRTIGRPHRAGDVDKVIDDIHGAGVTNFSLDIMYGVPGQRAESLRADLDRVAASGATHVSCFRLEIIPTTNLRRREEAGKIPERLGEAQLNEFDELIRSTLDGHGYRQYGAFNFAKPGYESVHNDVAFGAPQSDYIGFGNSAYSYFNDYIYANQLSVPHYIAAVEAGTDPIWMARKATGLEQMSRYFVLGVKLERVPRRGFIEEFGVAPEEIFGAVIDDLAERGMMRRDGDDYVLTDQGSRYVNNVCKAFYVGDNRGRSQYAKFIPTVKLPPVTKPTVPATAAA